MMNSKKKDKPCSQKNDLLIQLNFITTIIAKNHNQNKYYHNSTP